MSRYVCVLHYILWVVILHHIFRPNIRVVDRFKVGRVFVVGGTEHIRFFCYVMTKTVSFRCSSCSQSNWRPGGYHYFKNQRVSSRTTQGMNTSIQDSFNLGWKLSLVVKGLAHPSLLDTYSEERLPVVSEMLKQTTKLLNGMVKSSKDDGAWNRSGTALQLGINYRWSSIVLDEVKKTDPTAQDSIDERSNSYGVSVNDDLQAGDRAPDSSDLIRLRSDLIVKKSSLFRDVFGPSYHTVLIFAQLVDAKASLQWVAGYPKDVLRTAVIVPSQQAVPIDLPDHVDLVFEDRKGHAHEAYTGRKCGIIVVRPDGVVGAMARDPQWLDRYFKGILLEPFKL